MLKIVKNLGDMSFSQLMEIYREGNLENGQERYPEEPLHRQLYLAEQDFYDYLSQVFFRTKGAVYLIWSEAGYAVSALRLEPYEDGLLLEALETAPEHRRNGYAKALILGMLELYGGEKIYAHVHKRNIPSQRTHEACGFYKIMEYALYADGSVMQNSVTYCHE